MKKTSQKGFTLIELMVVILIIAILGALGIVSYGQANQGARNGKRRADAESVRQALLLYRQETQCLPNALSVLVPTYLNTVPADPTNSGSYIYTYSPTGSGACRPTATFTYRLEPGATLQTLNFP